MTEFYHNHSIQALGLSNDSFQMTFESIENLVKKY